MADVLLSTRDTLVLVFLKFAFWLFMEYASAPGRIAAEGIWQWRTVSWLVLPSLLHLAGNVFSFLGFCLCSFLRVFSGRRSKVPSQVHKVGNCSNDRPTRMGDRTRQTLLRMVRSIDDQPTRMGESRVSESHCRLFRYSRNGSLSSTRSAQGGYSFSESEGSLELFFKGRFLKTVFYATSTSASSGALRWFPRGTQGLFQDARNKVFSVREEVRSATRCSRRPFAFKGSVNSTQPASSEKQSFTRRQRGVKSESTKQATVTPQLFSLVCHLSVKVTSVPVARFLVCELWSVSSVVLTEVCGGTPVMWQDDVTPSKSLKEEGWKHNQGVRDSGDGVPKRVSDSRDRGLRSQRASKSSRPGLTSVTGQVKASGTQSTWPVQCDRTSEGFWKSSRTGLSHPAREDE